MRNIVLSSSKKLGICSVTIDARIIFEKFANQSAKDYSSSFPPSLQDNTRPGCCNIADAELIVKQYSPCMLLIENLDSMIYGGGGNSGDPSSQTMNEENEFQEIFAVTLGKFLKTLWAAVSDSAKEKEKNCVDFTESSSQDR